MIELQVVWAREGHLCLWGLDEAGVAASAETLGRRLAGVGAAEESAGRRVLSLGLPGDRDLLAPALVLDDDGLFSLLNKVAEEVELAESGEAVLLGPELRAGGSLRWTAALDRLALELIAAGRILPGLQRSELGWRADWRAATERKDEERLGLLANAAPGSLFAANLGDLAADQRGEAISRLLDHLIDRRARQLLVDAASRAGRSTPRQPSRSAASHTFAWAKALATPGGEIDAPEGELSTLADQLKRWTERSATGAASGRLDSSAPARAATEGESEKGPRKLTVTLKTGPAERLESEEPSDEGRLFALDGLCEFEWRVAVGDQRLTVAELRELAASQLPLIKSDGRWTVVSPQQVNEAIDLIDRYGESGRAHAGELLRDSLALRPGTGRRGAGDEAKASARTKAGVGAPIELEGDGWLRSLTGDAETALSERPQPQGLRGELRPYQRRGFAWLDLLSQLGLGACLADDMGLGKTIQLLALLLAERERAAEAGGPPPGPTLLICPVSVVGNWRREAERFAPQLRVMVHYGPDRDRGLAFRSAVAASDLVITSYSLVTRDRDLLGTIAWERITLDEAQHIKSRRARQTQAIRSLEARHRIALTGTPVENRLTELHSIMDFLNPGLLGSADAFKQQIARPIEQWRDPDAAAQLRQATSPFILRRLKTDSSIVPDLPEKIEMRTDCLLTKEQASLYQAVVDDLMTAADQPEGIARSGAILAALTRLKQVCNHPGALLGDGRGFANRSGKLERLEEILEEALAEGDRALCFTQFSGFGQRLAWHLAELFDREVLFLHGGSSREERDQMVDRFQAAGGPSIFVLSLRAGGTGLNLTAANQVIHFDRWWNPAVEDQATDRAYRIGQKRTVQVRKLTCVGTLEERIDLLLERKRELAEMVVGNGESWITEMDSSQLRELVALSPEAIDLGESSYADPSWQEALAA